MEIPNKKDGIHLSSKIINNPINCLSNKKSAVIFGAGESGQEALQILKNNNMKIKYFIDNFPEKYGYNVLGCPIYKPAKELFSQSNDIIFICSDWASDIAKQLKKMGVKNFTFLGCSSEFKRWINHFDTHLLLTRINDLEKVHSSLYDSDSMNVFESIINFRLTGDPALINTSNYQQYFHPIVKPYNGDTIFDGGAWIGDTVFSFLQTNDDSLIVAFEPDENNFLQLRENIKKKKLINRVTLIKKGLWNETTKVSFEFHQTKSSRSRINIHSTNNLIEVICIDDFIANTGVVPNLIKMDIEGAELSAIRGAKKTLSNHKPKLQISIYHRPEDLWEIPISIANINPQYRFYIGHHSQHLFETILYAI